MQGFVLGSRALSGGMLGFALGFAGCSGDPLEGQAQSSERTPSALPAQLGEARLSVELSSLNLDTGHLLYAIKNNSSQSVHFLHRDTALRGVAMNMFDVRLGAVPVAYVGPHVYWDEPRPQDFVELSPGASVEGLVDLPALYDMKRAGEYTVQARRRSVTVRGEAPDLATRVVMDASAATVVRLADTRRSQPVMPKFLNFAEDCSATDLANMSAAETTARRLGRQAVTHLQNMFFIGDTGGRYERWFGAPEREPTDVRRVESVLSQALSIDSGLPVTQFRCRPNGVVFFVDGDGNEFGCGPTMDRPVTAVTNRSPGSTVQVCPSFLSSSERRKASVMIHELSHHYGTDDFVNGIEGALDLAITDPDSATESAENYEHYVLEFF